MNVQPYAPSAALRWNEFVSKSRTGTFLLRRDYMDYHADRFSDRSLMVSEGEEIVALLPLSQRGADFSSHGGLTYGGLLTGPRVTAPQVLEVFRLLGEALVAGGVERFVYKPIPHIYHRIPAEDDLYALFRSDARLVRRDVSSAIPRGGTAGLTKGRKWAINKARKAGVQVAESMRIRDFMRMEAALLAEKYGTRPTHSEDEMELLASRFPENIRLFTAELGGELLGGVLVYETESVAHAQYISSSERGRSVCAVDAVLSVLLGEIYQQKAWFDFGISTTEGGRELNSALDQYKESWGARTVVYDWYEVSTRSMLGVATSRPQ